MAAFVVGCSGEDLVSTGVTDSALAGGGKELWTRKMRERPRLQFDVPLQVGGLQIPWLEVQDSRCAEGAIVAATYADDGAVQIDVDFDPVWGYPVSLYIGQDRRIADEEP